MKAALILSWGLVSAAVGADAPAHVHNTRFWQDDRTGLTIVAGDVELPSHALWVTPPGPWA